MDVGNGCRSLLKKFVEQTLDKDNWINCACWVKPARDPRRGKSYSGLEKANRRMNFSTKVLYALIHDLKQQQWQIRRVDRSGMRTKLHSPAFKFETELEKKSQYKSRTSIKNP